MQNHIDVSNIMVNAMEEHEVLSASGDNSMLGNMRDQKWWSEQSEEIKKYIEDNDEKIFFCSWEGYLGEIHTEQSLYSNYKHTNLYDREEFYGGIRNFGNYGDFYSVVKYSDVKEMNTEDNMTIVRLKWM